MNYTPGPWNARGTTVWADAETPPMGHEIIANTRTARGDAHDMANAHLIAAAPAMYEALKQAMEDIEAIHEKYFPGPGWGPASRMVSQMAEALAQADGSPR